MKAHIITIFPEVFDSYFSSSMMKKALESGLFEMELYKLNDFSTKPQRRVDDKAYGMHGQVIACEPLWEAIETIFEKVWKDLKVFYMTPSWDLLNQEKVEGYLSQMEEEFVIICGHYEGIDQRIIDLYVDYEVSIGEYVLTSWELASFVFLDSLVRLIPGVIGSRESYEEESFSASLDRQKEYPVYTRPWEYKWRRVPEELLSGNPKVIEEWKWKNLKK